MLHAEIETSHLEPTRADDARRASAQVLTAAKSWATAPKHRVGAVSLPADEAAAHAFDAFHQARRDLAYHVGGQAAARWASAALSIASGEPRGH